MSPIWPLEFGGLLDFLKICASLFYAASSLNGLISRPYSGFVLAGLVILSNTIEKLHYVSCPNNSFIGKRNG